MLTHLTPQPLALCSLAQLRLALLRLPQRCMHRALSPRATQRGGTSTIYRVDGG